MAVIQEPEAVPTPVDEPETPIGSNAFVVELLKALNATLHKQNVLLRELLELVRDIRDVAATTAGAKVPR